MANDTAALSFSDDSSNKSPPTPLMLKEELYQELDELLTAFQSDAQQQFCMDQGIIQKDDLKRMQQTVQQLQYSLKTNNHPHHHQQLWPSLTRTIQNILQHYGYACQQRSMRLLDEFLTNQYITEWHRLKQQWGLKAKENQHLHLILEDIVLLAQSWHQHHYHNNNNNNNSTNSTSSPIVMMTSISTLPKRLSSAAKRSSLVNKRKSAPTSPSPPPPPPPSSPSFLSFSSLSSSTSEDILTSILTTFDYPPGAYMVTIDKHNYKQLGLQHSKIGTRQIIFDGHQLSTSNIISMMHHLSDAFTSLFAATAQTHLATIDTQIKKAQPFYTMNSMKQLLAQVMMEGESTMTSNFGRRGSNTMEQHSDSFSCGPQRPLQQPQQPTTSSSSIIIPQHRISRDASPPSSLAVLTPFRLSSPAPSNQPWHHPIPIPSFSPAPWQLPDLLKPRYPYNPLIFGLFQRRTGGIINNNKHQQQISSSASSSLLKHVLHTKQNRMTPRTSAPPPSKGNNIKSTTTTSKKTINVNAPNRSATHHYHASSSATINDGIDNNNRDALRPSPPRASTLTASTSPLLQHQHRHDSYASTRPKRYLNTRVIQEKEDKVKAADNESDDSDYGDWSGGDDQGNMAPTVMAAPFTSVSVEKLSFYLGKIAGQFYLDLLTHTRIRYQEAQETLEALEYQMLDLYRHLQLASSRAVMYRALMIVQELDGQQQQQQHYNYHPHQHDHCQQQQGQCSDYGCNINHQQQLYGGGGDSGGPSSSHDDSSDSTDSNSYHHTDQQATPPMVNRWTPICIDNYQDRSVIGNSNNGEVIINNNNKKDQSASLTTNTTFYNVLPPNAANMTMSSETTIQADEHSPPPSKDTMPRSKSETLAIQHMDDPTPATP